MTLLHIGLRKWWFISSFCAWRWSFVPFYNSTSSWWHLFAAIGTVLFKSVLKVFTEIYQQWGFFYTLMPPASCRWCLFLFCHGTLSSILYIFASLLFASLLWPASRVEGLFSQHISSRIVHHSSLPQAIGSLYTLPLQKKDVQRKRLTSAFSITQLCERNKIEWNRMFNWQ